MSIKFSFDFKGLLQSLKIVFTKSFWVKCLRGSVEGVIIYFAYFLITEIMISGGRYEQSIYLEIVSLLVIVTINSFLVLRHMPESDTSSIKRGFGNLLVFAILDFLLVNLLLNSNSGMMYKYWGNLANYAAVLVVPYIIYQIQSKKTSPEQLS